MTDTCPPDLGRQIAYEACVHELMHPTNERPGLSRIEAEARAGELMARWFKT